MAEMRLLILCALVGYAFGTCNETKLKKCWDDNMDGLELKPMGLMAARFDGWTPGEIKAGPAIDEQERDVLYEGDLLDAQLGPLGQNVANDTTAAALGSTVGAGNIGVSNTTSMASADTTAVKPVQDQTQTYQTTVMVTTTQTISSTTSTVSTTTTMTTGSGTETTTESKGHKDIDCDNKGWNKYYKCLQSSTVDMCDLDKLKKMDKEQVKAQMRHHRKYKTKCGAGGGAALKPLFVTLTTMAFYFLYLRQILN